LNTYIGYFKQNFKHFSVSDPWFYGMFSALFLEKTLNHKLFPREWIMAVIQAIFRHQDPQAQAVGNNAHFSFQVRRLSATEVNEWRCGDEIIIDWGDPAQTLDPHALALACRHDEARSLFGRSWIYYHYTQQRLLLGVDRLGLFPLLLKHDAEATYIASDALGLSQLPGSATEASPEALLELLAYGQLLGEQSTLRECTHLHAGTVCAFNAQGSTYMFSEAPFCLPREQGSEQQAIDSLVAAVARRFHDDPDILLPLSGGVDSRLLLAAAHAAGYHPTTFSFAPVGSTDFQIAQNLAAAIGAKFYSSEASIRQLNQFQYNVARLGGGEVPLVRGCALLSPELIARTRAHTLLTTTGAKTFRSIYYDKGMPGSELLSAAGLKKTLIKAARRYAEDAFDFYLTPFTQAWPSLQARFRERLRLRLDTYQSNAVDAAHYLDSVYLGEYVRRAEIAGQQLLARDYTRTHPFLDAEVLQQFAALPLSQRLGARFQRRAIDKLSPQLAAVTWGKTMRPLNESLRWEERYMGLATYLGIAPQGEVRPSSCDVEVQGWLNSRSEYSGDIIRHALEHAGVAEWEINNGLNSLLNHPLRLYALGCLSSFNTWSDYLGQRSEVLAA
jgi:hypothetical protein